MPTVSISALGQRGDGVGELGGKRVYVAGALPGELVEAEFDGDRGRLLSVLGASPDRTAPPCAYFGRCGGCTLQHLSPAAYRVYKQQLLETALRQAGITASVAELLDATGSGRRRATLHVRGRAVGYMEGRSHELLDLESCPILVPALREQAPRLARLLQPLTGDCDLSFTATDTGTDLDIRPLRQIKPERLLPLATKLPLARLTLDGEVVLQQRMPAVRMGKALVELPPGGFLQATAEAEAALAALVLDAVGKTRAVADLFSGVGPFTLRLAETSRVFAADSARTAIAALEHAARHTSGLKPITTARRDLFREPLVPLELAPYGAIVLDPPRAGAAAQVRELAASRVPTVVYVSCDPRSFARDAAILCAGGYRLERVVPVDQFAFSTHVELVGTFRR